MTLVERDAVSEVFELGAVLLEKTGKEEIDGEGTDVEGQMILIVLVARQPSRGANQPVVEPVRGAIHLVERGAVREVFELGAVLLEEKAGQEEIDGEGRMILIVVIDGEGQMILIVVIAGCLVIGGGIVKAGAGGNPLRPGGKIILIAGIVIVP